MMTYTDQPRIRTLNALPAMQGNRKLVRLEDPLGIADPAILIPARITPLLVLCDGSRSIGEIQSDYCSLYGAGIEFEEIHQWLEVFDRAGLLQNDEFQSRKQKALESYRAANARPLTLADEIYPGREDQLSQILESHLEGASEKDRPERITGMICPHIDFERGWKVYAEVMSRSRQAIVDAELIIVLGTDHFDDGNPLSLTLQNYQTPFGVMPTATAVVESLNQQLSGIDLLRGELRHQQEHSIELALVWLHHMRTGTPCPVLPILCGSHELFFLERTQSEFAWVPAFVNILKKVSKIQNTIIVAAADLAHVGEVFGGSKLPPEKRFEIALADEKLLQCVKEGDPNAFMSEIFRIEDQNNVCGITPIYLLLRALLPAIGQIVSYDICPADLGGNSWVSICGATFS